jgi:hypothetical protein
VLVVFYVGVLMLFPHRAPEGSALLAKVETKPVHPAPPAPVVETSAPAPAAGVEAAQEPSAVPQESNPPKAPAKAQKSSKPQGGGKQADPPPKDETARAALSYVGVDPEAEQYWISAINNPQLPAEERSNLIEDLNEDGLSDPKHPAPEDLPIILNRISLIEELADGAMDKVNADAFQEAYKDLVNLAGLASGTGGEPVR